MNGATVKMECQDNQIELDWIYLRKSILGTIRRGVFLYVLIENGYKYDSNCYSPYSTKFLIPFLWVSLLFYTILPYHLHPPRADQIIGVDSCPINPFLKSLGSSCKAENHCSGITSSLMRLES